MAYTFPESLRPLREWLKKHGADVNSFATDRQAAFMAQQLAGSRFKFPERGQPMFPVLLKIQEAVSATSPGAADASRQPKGGKPRPGKTKSGKHRTPFDHADVEVGLHIFCDGAAIPNPGLGGWGFVVYQDGKETAHGFGGDPDATNNQMEICALLNAIDKAKAIGGAATIWCDSEYCVKGATEWRHKWKALGWRRGGDNAKEKNQLLKNADLWKAIDEALTGPDQVRIKWVKGHAGTKGNERADELAEQGRRSVDPAHGLVDDELTSEYRQIIGG